ncbi:spliceosome associated factor 3, U4/U6 recycling protein-like [Babylonia areolata]|uniref:spliceosome associated factor 3, U4/U6 recycling protein-like n=1 Tax=Babylonia areolata TaxID=304850 RepID=UPI003FCF2D76
MAENMEEENINDRSKNETEDDNEMDDGSDDSDSDDTAAQDEARIRELEKEISKNPYLYDCHVELIQKLRELGELDRLRAARQAMQKCFPLSEEIWSQWLQDEIPLAQEKEDREKVEALFKLAIQDYVSVTVWLEYVQFAIGGMGEEGGIQHVREVFEQAITAVGLHVPMGATVWEAYREFENALLTGLMPQPGAVTTKEQEEAFSVQHRKVANLFKRQLTIPLMDMEETFTEYQEWLGGTVDREVEKCYKRALEQLGRVKPYEQQLLESEAPRLAAYQAYLEFELSEGDPARVQCLFERAILDNCLVPDLWLQYTKYLDEKLKIRSISMAAYDRALRNCPWSGALWRNYVLALERNAQPFDVVKGAMDKALMAGFTEASDYLQVWTVYIDYLRRRIDWTKDHEQDLETFRLTVERAADHLYENFGLDGDPEASLRQHRARIEARHCGNMAGARELWNQVMQEGYGSQASMWLSYYRLERTFGDVKHCRRILQRALNSVTDWLECITQAYIDFEREEGTLEDYEVAYSKCEAQLARVNERKAKAAEKEAALKEQQKQKKKQQQQKEHKKGDKAGGDKGEQAGAQQTGLGAGKWSAAVTGARSMEDKGRKRKLPEESTDRDGFKMPKAPSVEESPAKKAKEDLTDHGESIQHDPSKDNVTIFVSNLDYSTTEDALREAFQQCGEITEVRLVKNYKGLSKGFGYVQFTDAKAVLSALKLDRHPIDGRPMFVSRCEDRSSGRKTHQFKYATAMEKNKLFVKNLPFTCTAEALETIFKEHGKLKDVRLVTYRSGAPKGLAYVEYETEEMATHAILKTDGLQIGDHVISVAISNPPQRKQPAALAPPVPSLGGGKKDTEFHGKARTQVALVPRAVQRPGSGATSQKPSATSSSSSAAAAAGSGAQDSSGPKAKMSNDDFRKLLLK